MAHLWIEERPGDWAVMPLQPPRMSLDAASARDGGVVCVRGRADADRRADALLVEAGPLGRSGWHLIASPDVRVAVNGLPLLGGLRVMADRDEIRLENAAPCFFSTELLARVVDMPITDLPMTCPRCRQRIESATPAVACPACSLWHHQSENLPCWTYAPTCALCPQPTPLDAGFLWTPMDL